jgi:hypothetical protein
MSCCGGSKAKKRPTTQVEMGYRTTEKVTVLWIGVHSLRVRGCFTGNTYIFSPQTAKMIDENDAECLKRMREFIVG